jgi:chitinase
MMNWFVAAFVLVCGPAALFGQIVTPAVIKAESLSSPSAGSESEFKPRLVGYFWGRAARDGFKIQEAPTALLSDLIYSNVRPSLDDTCELTHPDVDPANFKALRALKERQPSLKILLSVAGFADRFSAIAASPKRTQHFVDSCVALAVENGFDGLDIDWEHPVNTGIPMEPSSTRHPEDRSDYVAMLRTFRSVLDRGTGERRVLTVATAGYYDHLADFDLVAMARYVDWFNLMIYDMSDMNPYVTADSSPLYEPSNRAKVSGHALSPSSADYAINWYLAHGVEAHKIVLGVPFYGHEWTGVSPADDGLFEAYKTHVTQNDPLPYREIQAHFSSARPYWDEQAKASWLYDPETQTVISFDNERALREKVRYVNHRGLGGIMFWDLTEDTASFHLLETLSSAMKHWGPARHSLHPTQ